MKKWFGTLLLLLVFTSVQAFDHIPSQITAIPRTCTLFLSQDSTIIETIDFEDMNDAYIIRQYSHKGNVVQMNIDRIGSAVEIDYIIWDSDKNGRLEAIGVYNVLDQQYEFHLFEEELTSDDLLEFSVQIEDIGFPGFFNSSDIPKALYKSDGTQLELNYYR